MNGKQSKFEYGWFFDGCSYGYFCVNKDKYTQEQARALFEQETGGQSPKEFKFATVRFGAGTDEDGEKRVCWWIDEESTGEEKRRCPVYLMH